MKLLNRIRRMLRRVRARAEAGMSTAEYAVGTVAAVAFAVVLYKIVRSQAVSSALTSIVNKALHAI
jgi:predicted membrane chloride channel (bestrophin family)